MDYIGMKCAACEEVLKNGDDVVVCPDCGAPHHRHCYESLNKCAHQEKHNETYEYVEEPDENNETNKNESEEDTVICTRCNSKNPKGTFYCMKCGYPMNKTEQQPFTNIPFNPFDPMAGIDPETDMGDGVTAGEMSKFTQDKTPYFSRVFFGIKAFNKGKFSFVGFIFSGGYLLYRKMYKLGALLTILMALSLIGSTYILNCTPLYEHVLSLTQVLYEQSYNSINSTQLLIEWYSALDFNIQILTLITVLLLLLQIFIQVLVGIKANKWYFNHCKKQIKNIKKNNPEEAKLAIETKGGVNTPLAISLFIAYIIINQAPYFLI